MKSDGYKTDRYLNSCVRDFLTAAMFGLPLIVTNGFFNITETKYLYFILLSAFFMVLSLVHIVFKRKKESVLVGLPDNFPGFTTIDRCVASFGIAVVLSAFFSSYPVDAWLGVSARYQGALTVIVYIIVYFLVSRNYGTSQYYLFFAVGAFCIVSAIGVLNCFNIDPFGFYHRLSSSYKTSYISTIGNINFYSSYFCLLFPLVICGYSLTRKTVSRIIYSFALVIGAFGMMVTASESFALGFAVSLCIIPIFFFNHRKKMVYYLQSIVIIIVASQVYNLIYTHSEKTNVAISKSLSFFLKPQVSAFAFLLCLAVYIFLNVFPHKMKLFKKIYIGFLITIVIVLAVCLLISNTKGLGQLDEYFKITSDWGTYRGKIWKFCLQKFRDFNFKEILFGVGPETLQNLTYRGELFTDKTVDQAHNEYIQYLLTTGIFGILSYLSILVAVSITVIKKLRHSTLAVGIFASLVAYWIQGTVNIAQPFTTPIMFLYVACIGGMWIQEKRENQATAETINRISHPKESEKETVSI
ncbi:MAG: O-antigen ligase family protein [Clostridia bacterium]|nr:O-antigen ligase family protein [Clostridia bacterium]